MNHKEHLLKKLRETVAGNLDYRGFEDGFYNYYITEVDDKDLDEKDHDFFTEVQERFEYTGEKPTEEDRQYNYIDYNEFVTWLGDKLKGYESN